MLNEERLESLERQLQAAERVYEKLLERKAGYTSISFPAELAVSIDAKEEEIRQLKERIAQGVRARKVAGTGSGNSEHWTSAQIADHLDRLRMEMRGDQLERLVELHLIPLALRDAGSGVTRHRYLISDLLSAFAGKPIAILGEAGAGKTTILRQAALSSDQMGGKIPFFVPLALYSDERDFDEVLSVTAHPAPTNAMNEAGLFLYLLDGLNEVALELRERAVRCLWRFMTRYPNNQYVITCRTSEYPLFLRGTVRRFEIERITQEQVMSYLCATLAEDVGRALYRALPPELRELCQNPLLLSMLAYLVRGRGVIDQMPASKSAIYREFLDQLHSREEELRSISLPQSVREEFVSVIALALGNETVTIERGKAERLIRTHYSYQHRNLGVPLARVLHEVLELPPLRGKEPGHLASAEVSFMHQSFQEFYTAQALLPQLADQGTEAVVAAVLPRGEHWWETLSLLTGLLEDATSVVRAICEHADDAATQRGDQRLFTLLAKCIRSARRVDGQVVDDAIIRTLLAFKFGKVAFDYDLIHGLKLIPNGRRSRDFPPRLIEDVNWWLEKYARAAPSNLSKDLTGAELIALIESEDEAMAIDALFTLRQHPDLKTLLKPLLAMFPTLHGLVREQLIATLGYTKGDNASVSSCLVSVINDTRESKWARAYALNALGRVGNMEAIEPMVAYLRDRRNPYRDSASWGLQGLVKRVSIDVDTMNQVRSAYLEALLLETDDLEGRYAKGNIVYSLGELGGVSEADSILEWLVGQDDPYVLEDGLQALGKVATPAALEFAVANGSHADPVVRLMATEAAAGIAKNHPGSGVFTAVIEQVSIAATDRADVVRKRSEQLLQELSLLSSAISH